MIRWTLPVSNPFQLTADEMRVVMKPMVGLLILMCAIVLPTANAGESPYKLGPDSMRQKGIPRGTVTEHVWRSEIFPNTTRTYWVYVPSQYDGSEPACVMIFQDGQLYVDQEGEYRVPIVFDNLIHEGSVPVTIGIFINPGHKGDQPSGRALGSSNRSFEYNALTDQYARFLLEELLPEIGKKHRLTDDPERRAVGGFSSGGICAFTVATSRRLPQGAQSRG
jgi:enterochelin esterase-like enzyme